MGTSSLDGVDDEISTPVIPSIFVRMEDFDTLQVKRDEQMDATYYLYSIARVIEFVLDNISISHPSLCMCICVYVCMCVCAADRADIRGAG